jgi:selenocysteine lyase/cysteine desulfurase
LLPWLESQKRGIEVTVIQNVPGVTRTEQICRALEQGGRLLALSTCLSSTGNRPDLNLISRVARSHGVQLFLDVSQSMGVIDLDLEALRPDFIAAHAYKWMLAPRGCSWMYIADHCLAEMDPIAPGWHSVERHHDEYFGPARQYSISAKRLDGGRPWLPWIGGLEAFRMLRQLPPGAVQEAAHTLSEKARRGLEDLGVHTMPSDLTSHILRIVPTESPGLVAHLRGLGIRCNGGATSLRIGLHGFNNDHDIDLLLEAVAQWKDQGHA